MGTGGGWKPSLSRNTSAKATSPTVSIIADFFSAVIRVISPESLDPLADGSLGVWNKLPSPHYPRPRAAGARDAGRLRIRRPRLPVEWQPWLQPPMNTFSHNRPISHDAAKPTGSEMSKPQAQTTTKRLSFLIES